MNAKDIEETKEKKTNFQRWRETCNPRDYKKYSTARNQAKWEYRKGEKEFEKKLAHEAKQNSKSFLSLCPV
jgi:beta-lactamase class D